MQNGSNGRRSSTNPIRVSLMDRDDKNMTRIDSRKSQMLKSKISFSAADVSHIPRPRMRSSSCDPTSSRRSNLKGTGKSLHQPTTPITPLTNARRLNVINLPSGQRSISSDRASNVGSKCARKDTRHLGDKNYQTVMLNKIDSYIHRIECSSVLNSNGSLKPITLKMFVEVSALLVKQIDPKPLVLTLVNYVEELPKIAKKLHYPGVITKSLLKTVNTNHSWPYVLGWLSWLVEICEVKELAHNHFQLDNLPFVGTEQQSKVNRNTLLFMMNMYRAWNEEKLDEEAALVNKYLQEVEKQQGVTEDELEEARAALDAEENSLRATENKSKDIEMEVKNLKDILMSLQEDAARQDNDIKMKEEYIKNLKIETEQLDTQCKNLQEQIKIKNEQRTELLSIVKEQPMSKLEKNTILNKCTELQNYMHQFDEHLKDIQKDIYTLDLKIASINNNLNKTVLAYNKEIFMNFGSDTNIDVEELKMPEKGILDPCIMDKLNEKANLMIKLKDELKQNLTQLESQIATNTNELELLQEKMRLIQEENVTLLQNLDGKKVQLNHIKTEESKLHEQIQIMRNDIQKYQESVPNLPTVIAELEEAKEKLDAVRRRKMYIEQNGRLFFDQLNEMFGEHRKELCKMLQKVEHESK